MFYALVILCLSGRTLAQIAERGRCPRVTVQPNFDLDRFSGRWYEAERFWNNFDYTSKGNVVDFTCSKNNTMQVVSNYIDIISGEKSNVSAVIHTNEKEPAKMVVHMPFAPPGTNSNLWVLGTDYDSYMIFWGCTVFQEVKLTYAWILTRDRHPKKSVMKKAYKVFKKNKLDTKPLFKVDQKDCDND